jgi:hypothetical protein
LTCVLRGETGAIERQGPGSRLAAGARLVSSHVPTPFRHFNSLTYLSIQGELSLDILAIISIVLCIVALSFEGPE